MNTYSNLLKALAVFCCISLQIAYVSSAESVIYWGQESQGIEQPLRHYCQESYDIIVVGFVYLFPDAPGGSIYPGMNFAGHCEVPFDQANPYLLNCTTNIAPDITYCQSLGKKIFLSFGGGVGQYGFSDDAQGTTFATMIWDMFLEGTGPYRPFGNSIFDGIDLDIEGGTTAGYINLISTLQAYFATSSRKYYISAAPQCFYPDRLGPGAGTPFSVAWFDYIWIQFYNNYCGLNDYPSNFNFDVWAAWATGNSVNPDVKLFIGAPASSLAAGSGYVAISQLETIANAIAAEYPTVYGGIMLWDCSNSDINNNYGGEVATFVHSQSSGQSTPAPSPASPLTTHAVAPMTTHAVPVTPLTTHAVPVTPLTTHAVPPVTPVTSQAVPVTPATTHKMTTHKSGVAGSTTTTSSSGGGGGASSGGNGVSGALTTAAVVVNTPVTTASNAPVSTTSGTTGDSSSSSSGGILTGSCTLGNMRCVNSNQYQSCGNGIGGAVWAAVQSCQVGLSCHESGIYIYCY